MNTLGWERFTGISANESLGRSRQPMDRFTGQVIDKQIEVVNESADS
jgi:hypothetical protein